MTKIEFVEVLKTRLNGISVQGYNNMRIVLDVVHGLDTLKEAIKQDDEKLEKLQKVIEQNEGKTDDSAVQNDAQKR